MRSKVYLMVRSVRRARLEGRKAVMPHTLSYSIPIPSHALRMRGFLNAILGLPHAEERPKGAINSEVCSRRTLWVRL